jgi:hypothetical protein
VKEEVPLIAIPFSVLWHESNIEILGNLEEGEHCCLVCMAYILDDILESMGYDLEDVFINMRDNINGRTA